MTQELPQSFYKEGERKRLDHRRLRIWAILLIGFTIWNLFTPYGLIRRNQMNPEFPNSQFGIQRAYINIDNELVLERKGYVDRKQKYLYTEDWRLVDYDEYDIYTGARRDSNPSLSSQYRTEGVGIDIKPGHLTMEKIRFSSLRLRGQSQPGEKTHTLVPLNKDGKADVRSLKEVAKDGVAIEDLRIAYLTAERPEFRVLPGHQYLPFKDAHCYVDPLLGDQYKEHVLFITTDSRRYLHRLLLNPHEAANHSVRHDKTIHLNLEGSNRFDSHLCHHWSEPKLMLLTYDGRISWFDDTTLELQDSYILDGNWQREYASLFQSTAFYSEEFGVPLTRVEAFRVYRILAVLLLVGIIMLIVSFMRREDSEEQSGTVETESTEFNISDLNM